MLLGLSLAVAGLLNIQDPTLSNSENVIEDLSDSGFYSKFSSLYPQFQGAILFLGEKTTQKEINAGGPENIDDSFELATVGGSSLLSKGQVLTIAPTASTLTREALTFKYKVAKGDTLSSIASDFGVSLETIFWANNMNSRSIIKPGDEITILPIDGVTHVVKRGDTVESITRLYRAEVNDVLSFNSLNRESIIRIGDVLIIPNGKPRSVSPSRANYTTPLHSLIDLTGYFSVPAQGRLTQGLHPYNAVDIGGRDFCNTPIYASANGRVIKAVSSGWNGGYGKFIKLSHPNGTVTLYAHNSELLVSSGDQVTQGEVIALMGDTGNTTGCHVHFEVRGARNPFGG